MDKAYFITFEGIDGCGKSTMAERLADYLRENGRLCRLTREPGGTEWGAHMRALLLHGEQPLSARTEALLFAADRAEHVSKLILPALAEGEWVICDRFADSTLAYQGGGRGMDMEALQALSAFAAAGLAPDLTFYLALPYETSLNRRDAQADRMECEKADFFERTAAVYEKLAAAEPQRVQRIDASLTPDEVWRQIRERVDALIREQK